MAKPTVKGPTKEGSAPRNSPATLTVPALRVYVRETFFEAGQGECWFPGSGIAGLTFEIDGKAVTGKKATTNKPHKVSAGLVMTIPLHPDPVLRTSKHLASRAKSRDASEATLSLAGVADGEHILKVIPDGQQTSKAPAGPTTTSKQKRLYRPLFIRFSLKNGLLTKAAETDPKDPKATINHGHVTAFKGDELCIDLKPDWLKVTAGVQKRRKALDMIVVHHTGGQSIGSALAEAINSKGPHYEIDLEGHVVKFVDDSLEASHAGGQSYWDGDVHCNAFSVGIELVHWRPDPPKTQSAFTEAQYTSLITLVKALIKEHKLKPHRIAGHSDLRTSKNDIRLLGSDRPGCPGPMFEWTRLEDEGLGMVPKAGVEIEDDWGGYFEGYSEPLKKGDSDKKKKYGGKVRKDVSGVIIELQRDLLGIGYSAKLTGEFDEHTWQAVDRFKRHFFTGKRKARAPKKETPDGTVDKDTASMILAVRLGLPGAPTKPAPATGKGTQGSLTPDREDDGECGYGYAQLEKDDDGDQAEA